MKISFFYRPKPKTSNYKPVFYKPEEEQSSLEKKLKNANDHTTPLRDRLSRRWEEERKHKAVSQKNLLKALAVIAALVYLIFFL